MKKQCCKCKKEIPCTRKYFYCDKSKNCGFSSTCIICTKEKASLINWKEKYQGRKEYFKQYRRHHLKEGREASKKYYYTPIGKINARLRAIKCQVIRRRKLGFNKVVENDWDCDVDWHHINNIDVVPIPRYLHQLCFTGDSFKHRLLCNRLVTILYPNLEVL